MQRCRLSHVLRRITFDINVEVQGGGMSRCRFSHVLWRTAYDINVVVQGAALPERVLDRFLLAVRTVSC